MVSYGYVTFDVVYQPQIYSTSVYHILITVLIERITVYYSAFVTFCVKHDLNTIFDLYVTGDFNIPDINWTTLSPPNSRDNEVPTHLADVVLNQAIDVATHKDVNIIDLIFLNLENPSKIVSQSLFSDHFPVVFQTQVSKAKEPISCTKASPNPLSNLFFFQTKT